jgi:hypothetical protein
VSAPHASAGRLPTLSGWRQRRAERRKGFDRPRYLKLVLAGFLIWTFAPIAIVVLFSFNSSVSLQNFDGFSTQWYSEFFGDQQLRESLVASLEIDGTAAVHPDRHATLADHDHARPHHLLDLLRDRDRPRPSCGA